MFMDFRDQPPPPPWRPRPVRRGAPALTMRQGRWLGWAIGINVAMLLLGPFAGSTVISAVVALGGAIRAMLGG